MGRFLSPPLQRRVIRWKVFFFRYFHFLTLSPGNLFTFLKLRNSPQLNFILPSTLGDSTKIACILDEFSFECFKFEADFHQVDLNTWKDDLESLKPQMLFVESAWRGKNGKWKRKISEISNEIIELVSWAKERSIPTVFWHKEVPPHLKTFNYVSQLFDFIFLTDADCISTYRKMVDHERVFFLPFACQPKIHNPIGTGERKKAILFAGTFYPEYKYPERYRDFQTLFDCLSPIIPIDIYERNAGTGPYSFPPRYQKWIRGSLPFTQISETYRKYQFGLNLNSVKHSQSMCSRRVFELLASNTIVVGNYSLAVQNEFGDLAISSDDPTIVRRKLEDLLENRTKMDLMKLKALRKVLTEHTYKHRFEIILQKINPKWNLYQDRILVFSFCSNERELEWVLKNFERQTYRNKTLIIFGDVSKHTSLRIDNVTFNTGNPKEHLVMLSEISYIAYFKPENFYGRNYLSDLALGHLFTSYEVTTKGTFFVYDGQRRKLKNLGQEYQLVSSFSPERSLIRRGQLHSLFQHEIIADLVYQPAVSVDRFNFVESGITVTDQNSELLPILRVDV